MTEAYSVDAVGGYPTLSRVLWDVCRFDDLEAGLFDILRSCSRRLNLTDERGELPRADRQKWGCLKDEATNHKAS